MNSSPASVVGILDRLSIGVCRISIRHGHTAPRIKNPHPELTGFKPGLGEKIWVHNHVVTGMIIYSHDGKLKRDSEKGLAQIPFTTKKQKPPVLREDYWTPLCLIEFPKGLGVVGRNVMQKLQEFRTRHELEWGYQAPKLKSLGKRERGEIIHNQKSNAVADIAAVLGGAGRGNRMWSRAPQLLEEAEAADEVSASMDATDSVGEKEQESQKETEVETISAADTPATTEGETQTPASEAAPAKKAAKTKKLTTNAPKGTLVKANIYWSNDADLHWARKWTDNVEHHLGLPSHVKNPRFKTKYILGKPEEAEVAKEAEAEQERKPEPEKKKGWFGFLGGKFGSSSADART